MTNFTKLIFCLFSILIIFTSCGDGSNTPISDEPKFEESVLTSIQVKTLPNKTEYAVGETLDATGLVLKATYTDYYSDESAKTSTRDISYAKFKDEMDFAGTDFSTSGTKSITVTYNRKSTSFEVTVRNSGSSSGYAEWFQIATFGENIKIPYMDDSQYKDPTVTSNKEVADYLDKYIEYVERLPLDENLTNVDVDFSNIKYYSEEFRFDLLIGTTKDDTGLIYSEINGINDICAPAVTEITKNIGVSDNKALDKAQFKFYYWAIANEMYKVACGTSFDSCGKSYYDSQKDDYNGIINSWKSAHTNRALDVPFDLYVTENNTTTLNSQIFTELDKMVDAAVTRFNNQGKNITKQDIYNVLNFSLTSSAIQGTHDMSATWTATTNHEQFHSYRGSAVCNTNEIVDVISNVQSSEMTS